jgi:macrolide transport system ATP-binding/permease protein
MVTYDLDTTQWVLELHKVSKQYGSEPAVHALVDVDLLLARGEWLAITGPSGAGKSTLLNIIGCLDRPTSGSFFFDGIDTAKLTDKQRAGLRSQRIGFVFQSYHLLPYRTRSASARTGGNRARGAQSPCRFPTGETVGR